MNIKKSFLSGLMILLLSSTVFGQIVEPVSWSFSSEKVNDTTYNIILKAVIDKGWHLYSQHLDKDDGPIETSFVFNNATDKTRLTSANNCYSLDGNTVEPTPEEEWDPNFEMTLKYFSHEVVFIQKILLSPNANIDNIIVNGSVEFMSCNDSQCTPPETIDFNISIGQDVVIAGTNNDNYNQSNTSLLRIFLLGFLGGLIALVTPCVWPMIPMTISFFLKSSEKKGKGIGKACYYGLSIMIIYVLLGLGITLIFGADALNALATNPWFNIAFFVLLIVFAASFLGAFELTLPSKWVNKMDSRAEKSSGFLGIFFMAFTLVLVSFSCTGPIIGTLLVEAVVSGVMAPLVGMTGFSLALAIPFTLFAIFPSWLTSMPKSGGWMNSIKVVLGFLEIALALKFLSVADLTMHWRFLDRETFLVLWIVLFALLGFYLLGKLKFKHDSDTEHVGIFRFFLAVISLSFSLYMLPGLWGAPLKAISAFAPPMHTQDFDMNKIVRENSITPSRDICTTTPKYSNLLHLPDGLKGYFDYDEGLACAKAMNKPVFIDFTGHGCVNCRNMENAVWIDPKVRKILNEDYIIISLFVDDKTPLPDNEITTADIGGKTKKIKTIGNKWSYYQASIYGSNSQPFYVLVDSDGKMLAKPHAYDLNVNNFLDFLNTGLKNFNDK